MHKRSLLCVIALFTLTLSLAFSGCFVAPIKMRTLTKDPAGKRALVPSDVPVPGQTTREQVEEKFGALKLDSGEPSLFWGHFEKSSWAIVWAVGAPYGGGDVGGERLWSQYEILATFDENDIVQSFDLIPPKAMVTGVSKLQKLGRLPPLDLSAPIELNGTKVLPSPTQATLELSPAEIKATINHPEPKPSKKPKRVKPPVIASIPVAQIVSIAIEWQPREGSPAFYGRPFSLGLKFSRKTRVGKGLDIALGPRESLTLIRWYEQQSPAPADARRNRSDRIGQSQCRRDRPSFSPCAPLR